MMKINTLIMAAAVFSLPALASTQALANSQPFVVLEYQSYGKNGFMPDNPFVIDEDYSASHTVQPGETLSHVMEKHYIGSGLNMQFIEMAIVMKNKHAFVRGNPNFLYADKTLHLPSLNEIKAMIMGQNKEQNNDNHTISNDIYFFGG
jgi:Tfp pilus assembly protein FimV